jgi:gas vesicle protein
MRLSSATIFPRSEGVISVSTESSTSGYSPLYAEEPTPAGSRVADAGDTVTGSPALVRAKTQGNPLAAGLIAFGAGLLVASLIPTTEREQQAATTVKDNLGPIKDEVTAAAHQAADNLREPAQEAVASVKQTATEAVQNTTQEGTSAAEGVKSDARDAAGTLQDNRS